MAIIHVGRLSEAVRNRSNRTWYVLLSCVVLTCSLLSCASESDKRQDKLRRLQSAVKTESESVQFLADQLEPDDEEVAYWALLAIIARGRDGIAALPRIVPLLDHPSVTLRGTACEAVATIGVRAQSAIPLLAAATEDTSGLVREGACRALCEVVALDDSTLVPTWMRCLGPRSTLSCAFDKLKALVPFSADAVETALNDDLVDGDLFAVIAKPDYLDGTCLVPLLAAIRSPTPETRLKSLLGLSALGSDYRWMMGDAIESIRESLDDPDARIRAAACPLLASIDGGHAVNGFIRALNDSNVIVRIAATRAMGAAGSDRTDVDDALLEALWRERDLGRSGCNVLIYLAALRAIDKSARRSYDGDSALMRGFRLLEGRASEMVQPMLFMLMLSVPSCGGPDANVDDFLASLSLTANEMDWDYSDYRPVARVLAAAEDTAIDDLIALVKSPDPDDGAREQDCYVRRRRVALLALGQMGPRASSAVPELVKVLSGTWAKDERAEIEAALTGITGRH